MQFEEFLTAQVPMLKQQRDAALAEREVLRDRAEKVEGRMQELKQNIILLNGALSVLEMAQDRVDDPVGDTVDVPKDIDEEDNGD